MRCSHVIQDYTKASAFQDHNWMKPLIPAISYENPKLSLLQARAIPTTYSNLNGETSYFEFKREINLMVPVLPLCSLLSRMEDRKTATVDRSRRWPALSPVRCPNARTAPSFWQWLRSKWRWWWSALLSVSYTSVPLWEFLSYLLQPAFLFNLSLKIVLRNHESHWCYKSLYNPSLAFDLQEKTQAVPNLVKFSYYILYKTIGTCFFLNFADGMIYLCNIFKCNDLLISH